jgi:hypothetical protein
VCATSALCISRSSSRFILNGGDLKQIFLLKKIKSFLFAYQSYKASTPAALKIPQSASSCVFVSYDSEKAATISIHASKQNTLTEANYNAE